MNPLTAVFATEWRRYLTASRIAWWLVLAAFPIAVTLLIRVFPPEHRRPPSAEVLNQIWSMILYALIPCVCCALGVFLNAAPAIAAELEQHSWVYLATRPNGIFWLLLGKYLVAVTWAVSCAVTAATGAFLIIDAPGRAQIWFTMVLLSVASSMAYAALYLLMGAIFPRRAMVLSVVYTVLVEGVLSLLPAVINRLTIQFRLRSILVRSIDVNEQFEKSDFFKYAFSESSVPLQFLWLLTLTAVFLVAGIVLAHRREFTGATETDV